MLDAFARLQARLPDLLLVLVPLLEVLVRECNEIGRDPTDIEITCGSRPTLGRCAGAELRAQSRDLIVIWRAVRDPDEYYTYSIAL